MSFFIDMDRLDEMLGRLEAVALSMAESADISERAAEKVAGAASRMWQASSSMCDAANGMQRASR